MRFGETSIAGAFVLDIERFEDERGFFARVSCVREFSEHGLAAAIMQTSIAYNRKKGTLRGLHYQAPPGREAKYVRCTRGAILDVVVDIRPNSPSFLRHIAVELTADNRRGLYVSPGLAHGYQTLTDDTEVFYQMSDYHAPELARGFRWDDPAFGIAWPDGPRIINSRDNGYPPFSTDAVEELRVHYPGEVGTR